MRMPEGLNNVPGKNRVGIPASLALIWLLVMVLMGQSGCTKSTDTREMAMNVDFQNWSSGNAMNPDHWLLGGDGEGRVSRDSSVGRSRDASVRLENLSGIIALYQDLEAASTRSQKYIFSAWVKASEPNSVCLALSDCVQYKYSQRNTHAGAWELLTLDGKIEPGATCVRLHINVYDGAIVNVDSVSFKVEKP